MPNPGLPWPSPSGRRHLRDQLAACNFARLPATYSPAGIYALMSFTVAKRRREIGIRAALGADPRRVLMGIFGRASAQIGAGVAAGLAVAAALEWLGSAGLMGGRGHVLLPAVAGVMFIVGILAALGPARPSAWHWSASKALREE